ncbi:hypothetical protein BU56_27850 [Escherichia coli O145:H25 str. 07-3858]|nr:hypothetical protein BU56_27850 [Escherichia coli O145:H25 str. 07-3858]
MFFDLDGTLHQQDMFGSFLRYLLRRQPLNALLVLPLLPIIAIALLIKGRAARWPMSLLLWGGHFWSQRSTFTDVAGPISCAGFATMLPPFRWFRSD